MSTDLENVTNDKTTVQGQKPLVIPKRKVSSLAAKFEHQEASDSESSFKRISPSNSLHSLNGSATTSPTITNSKVFSNSTNSSSSNVVSKLEQLEISLSTISLDQPDPSSSAKEIESLTTTKKIVIPKMFQQEEPVAESNMAPLLLSKSNTSVAQLENSKLNQFVLENDKPAELKSNEDENKDTSPNLVSTKKDSHDLTFSPADFGLDHDEDIQKNEKDINGGEDRASEASIVHISTATMVHLNSSNKVASEVPTIHLNNETTDLNEDKFFDSGNNSDDDDDVLDNSNVWSDFKIVEPISPTTNNKRNETNGNLRSPPTFTTPSSPEKPQRANQPDTFMHSNVISPSSSTRNISSITPTVAQVYDDDDVDKSSIFDEYSKDDKDVSHPLTNGTSVTSSTPPMSDSSFQNVSVGLESSAAADATGGTIAGIGIGDDRAVVNKTQCSSPSDTKLNSVSFKASHTEASPIVNHGNATMNTYDTSFELQKSNVNEPEASLHVIKNSNINQSTTSTVSNISTSSKREPSVSLNPIVKEEPLDIENDTDVIYAVCVVGFHHVRGPEVEYWVGGDGQDHSKLWPNLPFQSLPDGSHSHEENFCYFSLLYDNKFKTAPISVPIRDKLGNIIEQAPDLTNVTTLFGISCNRQIKASDLKEKPADVTRSTVQKSVIVIARKPIFGAIREKLAVITRAYFQQGDFEDRSLINNLYENLVQMFSNKIDENDMYVGMSLRELVFRLKSKVLLLLKALLLERKIFFYGSNTETLCSSQFALVSLIPNLINHMEDCGSPLLNSYEKKLKKPTSLKSSDRLSLLHYMGLPLQIFSEGGMFSAYVPLQQMNELKAPETRYFLVGSTNSLLLAPQNRVADVVVHIDNDHVEVLNTSLNGPLALSSSDKKWIDSVVRSVVDTWDPEDPWRPKGLGFIGSEDYVRQQFEDYIMGLLSSIKYDKFLTKASRLKGMNSRVIPKEIEGNPIKLFNPTWVKEWRTTNNFRIFSKYTDDELFDIVEPRHMVSSLSQSVRVLSSNSPSVENTTGGSNGLEETPTFKPWGSFFWPASTSSTSSLPDRGPNSSPKDDEVLRTPKSNYPRRSNHQSKPSDDFQDTSLDESKNSYSTSTTATSSPQFSFFSKNRSVSSVTNNGSNHSLTPTRSNSSNTSSSQQSHKSSSSGFFSNWSLWGSNNSHTNN